MTHSLGKLTTPKRRWHQFSLRTMLVIITLLCIGPGSYVAYEQNKARALKRAIEAIEQRGGYVFYEELPPTRSPQMRLILGDETLGYVNGVDLNPLKTGNHQITDADLKYLQAFPRLNYLVLKGCQQITDAGLKELSGLPTLQTLNLNDTPISDAGLVHLAGLKSLQDLSLSSTQVTDAGLAHLSGLTRLDYLFLYSTRVTQSGADTLQKSLPKCRINR